MSVCERIFAEKRFPGQKDNISKAYSAKELLEKSKKNLEKLYVNCPKIAVEQIKEYIAIYDVFLSIDSNLCDFLKTNITFNKKRQVHLDLASDESREKAKTYLEKISKLDNTFKEYGFNGARLLKLVLKTRASLKEVEKFRDLLKTHSSKPEKHFRSLFKV